MKVDETVECLEICWKERNILVNVWQLCRYH
jgi:hypothetical protein